MNHVDRFGSFSGSRGSQGPLHPSPGVLVESVEDSWLESLEDHAIGLFDLTISTWMSDRGPVNPDAVFVTEVQELLPGEVSSMVSDDTVRNAKPIDDVEEELDCIFRVDVGDGLGSIHLVNLSTATSR